MATDTNMGGEFTADKDYYGETEDGRSFLKVAKGVTIPMAEAQELGVVKGKKAADAEPAADETASEESDTAKSAAPPSNKAQTPAKNKAGGR